LSKKKIVIGQVARVVNTLTWDPTSPQKNRIEIGENKNEEEKNNRKTMKKKTLHTKKVTSKNFFFDVLRCPGSSRQNAQRFPL